MKNILALIERIIPISIFGITRFLPVFFVFVGRSVFWLVILLFLFWFSVDLMDLYLDAKIRNQEKFVENLVKKGGNSYCEEKLLYELKSNRDILREHWMSGLFISVNRRKN